jgi:DNA primase
MSLPPGFIEELRNQLSLAAVVGRKVVWDSRKSNTGKGDYWAPCPFHQEKTASFHVDDRKGFYYCFGCHAKGDALNFVRETENVGFMEAVEILAREAGMTMPARDPRAREKADRRTELVEVMEQAAQFFRLQLKTAKATAARDYLDQRGLPETTRIRFEIGFAANNRVALFHHLTENGVAADLIVDAGLCIKPDDGGAPYDRFRNRIMFPIRDARGRCIAFGGRAMDPNARAKYLNSPETPLFDKGRSLYHHAPAREAAGKAQSLIVAEGYMDVIALAQAGFAHAVAPLGTAITEHQLTLMWRICPEPIIALDGDAAGLRAAMRLIDIALPLLEAGKSLRFCLLPQGLDPDDLIRASGAAAMQGLLDQARPMVSLLWQREVDGKVFDSPERRAALDASLRHALNSIRDRSVKNHYEAAIRALRAELFASGRRSFGQAGKRADWRKPAALPATPGAKSSLLAQESVGRQAQLRIRESVILAAALAHPQAAAEVESDLERCPFGNPDLNDIRNALLSHLHEVLSDENPGDALCALLAVRLGYHPLEKLTAQKPVRLHPHLQPDAAPDLTRQTLLDELARQSAMIGAEREIREAAQDLAGLADEGTSWRLQQASEARNKAVQAALSDDDIGTEEARKLSQHLQKMIDGQIWIKKKH